MDRTEATIHQNLYWPDIRDTIWKEVINCNTCQRKKRSNKKYGKLPAKVAEEIPWNKICIYLIGTYVILCKGKKENLQIKPVKIIDPVTRLFDVVLYDDKGAITTDNLVETTWLSIYPRSIEITYDQ